MLVIVDFGAGNVGSIARMLERAGVEAVVGRSPEELLKADRLILPGVGAFDSVMTRFRESGLLETTLNRHKAGVPILGICVGMQILGHSSDEGVSPGLGLLSARTRGLRSIMPDDAARVPHMGWSSVQVRRANALLQPLPDDARFYFVHSFAVVCDVYADCIGSVEYGGAAITAAVQRQNLFGIQFHPEKSRHFGMTLLRNFAAVR